MFCAFLVLVSLCRTPECSTPDDLLADSSGLVLSLMNTRGARSHNSLGARFSAGPFGFVGRGRVARRGLRLRRQLRLRCQSQDGRPDQLDKVRLSPAPFRVPRSLFGSDTAFRSSAVRLVCSRSGLNAYDHECGSIDEPGRATSKDDGLKETERHQCDAECCPAAPPPSGHSHYIVDRCGTHRWPALPCAVYVMPRRWALY